MPDCDPSELTLADLETRLVDAALTRSQRPYDSSVRETAASDAVAQVGPLSDQLANLQELLRHPLPDDGQGVIGKGGQAVVYSYVQRGLGREVAVKALRPEAIRLETVESLVREACVTARLEHPNIVPVHALHLPEHDADPPYWVMKRIQGRELTAHLPGHDDPWPTAQLLPAFRRVLNAVAFAHSRGIVHRDLKPDNVLVGEFGEVQVTDWGLAVALTEEAARGATPQISATLTGAGRDHPGLSEGLARLNAQVLSGAIGAPIKDRAAGGAGTPLYMAPEQLSLLADDIDERTDVFLLGGLLYSILTGEPPHRFAGCTNTTAPRQRADAIRTCRTIVEPKLHRQAMGLAKAPEGLTAPRMEGLSAIAMKALSLKPEDRFQDVGELVEALDQWEARSSSAELLQEAKKRWQEAKAAGRQRSRHYAEVIALANASLDNWPDNRDADALHAEASQALAAIQRSSARRLLWATIAIALVFVVAAIGFRRTHRQRRRAEEARRDAEGKAVALAHKQRELAERFDDAYWEAYQKFGQFHDPLAQVLVAANADARVRESGITSRRSWPHLASIALGSAPRLVGGIRTDGHPEALCLSPDGRLIASAASATGVRLWDLATGKPAGELKGHSSAVTALSFSPDGKRVASGSRDGSIRIWDLASHRVVAAPRGHRRSVTSLSFSPDGKKLASCAKDIAVRIWDAATGEEVSELRGRRGPIGSACFSPNGALLATGGTWDGAVRVWDAGTGVERNLLRGHVGGVTAVCFSPDGTMLASAGADKSICLWSVTDPLEPRQLTGHSGAVEDLCFSPDGSLLASASRDGTGRLWDVATESGRCIIRGHSGRIRCSRFTADGSTLVMAGSDRAIRLWDLAAMADGQHIKAHQGRGIGVAFSADGERLITCGAPGSVRIWDMPSRRRLMTLPSVGRTIDVSADGTTIAGAGRGADVRIWDTGAGLLKATLADQRGVRRVWLSRDGRTLALMAGVRAVRLWDIETRRLKQTIRIGSQTVSDLDFSPDGRVIAIAGAPSQAELWDVTTGRRLPRLESTAQLRSCVRFNPDGHTFAAAASDRSIRLLDVATGKERTILRGHDAVTKRLCFSADSALLASTSQDSKVKLWDTSSGREVVTLGTGGASVHGLSFSPSEPLLAAICLDGTVRLWRVPVGAALSITEAIELTGTRLVGFEAKSSPVPPKGVPSSRWTSLNLNRWIAAAEQGHVEALHRLAVIRERQHRDTEAIELHREAVSTANAKQKRWADRSAQRLKTIPWLRPAGEAATRALQCFDAGQFDAGMEHYKQALASGAHRGKLERELAARLSERGMKYFDQQAYARAADYLGQAIKLAPSVSSRAYAVVGRCLYMAGRYNEATAVYRKALETTDRQPMVHAGLAISLVAAGQLDEAMSLYGHAARSRSGRLSNMIVSNLLHLLKNRPDAVSAHYVLGYFYERLGNREEATKHYDKYVQAVKRGKFVDLAKERLRGLE